MMTLASQRETDAAFFEDWSEWASLDDLPERPTHDGAPIIYGHRAWGNWSEYYCALTHQRGWIGGPHFEIAVPCNGPVVDLVRALPGARQHPGLWGIHSVAVSRLRYTWQVPATDWRAVRAALPAIKAATVKWVRTPR